MDILTNIEVRWFIDHVGVAATAAKRWFADVTPQPEREDRYFLAGRDDVGFKARAQGDHPSRIETKYLLGSLGPALLNDGFVGNLERWRKLSVEATAPSFEERGEWVKVTKSRRVRKFSCVSRAVKPIDEDVRAAAGCLIEMTELEYEVSGFGAESHAEEGDRRRAITVGVDAFGPDEMLLDVLLRVCEVALEPAKDLRLGMDRSESYPRWLARLVAARE